MKFGTDGIRGRFGQDITPALAWALGRALSSQWTSGFVGVARDTRPSGPALEAALCAGLRDGGLTPMRMGVFPTPALSAVLRRQLRSSSSGPQSDWVGGVMITASHNPAADNGLKVLNHLGNKPDRDFLKQLGHTLAYWLPRAPPEFPADPAPETFYYLQYLGALREAAGPLPELRILVDCANGAGQVTAPAALRDLGAVVESLHTGDGSAINLDCGSLHPENLAASVVASGADYGIALDGDADRGILILRDGRILDGDDLLWLCSASLPAGATVVGTIMTNAGLEQALSRRGLLLERTPVGDAYVADALLSRAIPLSDPPFSQISIGGEPSGHLLLSSWIPTADGLLACILGIRALQAGAPLEWPRQPQIQKSRRFSGAIPDETQIQSSISAAQARWVQAGARIVVRPSGTEPLIRVMVEHPDARMAEAAALELLACLPT